MKYIVKGSHNSGEVYYGPFDDSQGAANFSWHHPGSVVIVLRPQGNPFPKYEKEKDHD